MHWITKIAIRIIGERQTKKLISSVNNSTYVWIKVKNKVRKTIRGRAENKYLFILSPPFCGSTLLNHIISSSSNVSSNNTFHSREGQQLPKVKEHIFLNKKRWNPDTTFDWPFVKSEWEKYWDTTKAILLEKSPCHIVRADALAKAFDPAYFVIIYRNPYAHCEGVIRRNKWEPRKAAMFVVKCLRFQRKNINHLKNHISFSYEQMTEQPEQTFTLLQNYLPELNDLQISKVYPTQNVRNESLGITNLNDEKIKNLTSAQLEIINEVFRKHRPLLRFFNYHIISPKT